MLKGERAHGIKQRWLVQALDNARIDPARWHPSAGVASNRETIERVYQYYARLYLANPFFEWAGMATLIGPAFYAGFRDLGALPDAMRRLVGYVFGRASRRLARWAAGDLGFYEATFLLMQKKIFEDQAVMHEAYLGGGIDAIDELRDAAIIDDATFEAWTWIDAGKSGADAKAVGDGNRELLFREQFDVIDRFYLRMFDHPPLGRAFTYVLTLAGAPSLPGAKSFAEVFPLLFRLPLASGAPLAIATPLAAGNIAIFGDRWSLIETDTLPDYLRLIQQGRDQANALIATPIAQRVGKFRLLARVGQLARNLLTHWRLVRGDSPEVRVPDVSVSELKTPLTIDLQSAPECAASDLAPGRDSRTWENPSRSTFGVVVRLPGSRDYTMRARRAVLWASRRGQPPDRLLVTLPTLDLEGAYAALNQLAVEWNIPAADILDWRRRTELRARAEGDYQHRAYSTHVFTAANVGPVGVQLQVAQHLREGAFVLTALFRWSPAPV
jgi:hypothetical protein